MTKIWSFANGKRGGVFPLLGALVPLICLNGCQSLSNTDKGALAGGGIGAGTGALIGSATHHTGAGALIGGAVGALAGGLTGAAIDDSEQKQDAKLAAATAPPARGPMLVQDVAQMARDHISDEVIVNQIRTSRTIFNLSVDDINYLKQNGVSDPVIAEMQNTVYHYPRRVFTPAPVVVVEPGPPPPPVGVGVGFSYSTGGHWR
jgi:outer membrane lipoprotein SlyB